MIAIERYTSFVSTMRRRMIFFLSLLVVTTEAIRHAAELAAPFIVFALIGIGWAALGFNSVRSRAARIAAFSLCIMFACLAETETFFYVITRPYILKVRDSTAWRRRDFISGLGDVTVPGVVVAEKEFHNGRIIYDAVYSIDPNGLRHIPAGVEGGPFRVAFVGCSYMFGHGLNDDQTLPYFFLRDAHGKFHGYNFGVDGWGPHEVLREIELGKVAAVVARPDLVVYEAIGNHIVRASGRAIFDPFGPKYLLRPDGTVCYRGPFHSPKYEGLLKWLRKSWSFYYLESLDMRRLRRADIPLYVSILIQIRKSVERNGGRFVVLFWDGAPQDDEIVRALQAEGFNVIRVSSIIPNFRQKQSKYLLSPIDRHPTAEANRLMADYLFRHVGNQFQAPRKQTSSRAN